MQVLGSRHGRASSPRRRDGVLQVVILGAGSAGVACALRTAEGGAEVTLIESGTLGGTCVNVGCIPSKILIRAAQVAHLMRDHPFVGVARSDPQYDRARHVAQQQARVTELRQRKYEQVLANHPDVRLLRGCARFTDSCTIAVALEDGTEQMLHADRVLIAAGASPLIPPVPGLRETPYWTSREALVAPVVPEHLVILGGSAVALEFAQAFRRMGTRVTLLARSTLLSNDDPDLGMGIHKILEDEGIDVHLHTVPQRVDYQSGHFELMVASRKLRAGALLVATGRRPNTDGLRLDAAGIVVDGRGAIPVDDHLRTSVRHIYAAGDCTVLPQFVYVAAAAGTGAAINMLGGERMLDLATMPAVVFTDPQVAMVGLDERRARKQGLEPDTRTLTLDNVPRALANFDTRGFIKLVANKRDGRLLGAQILAPEGGEIIQTAALAIRNHMTVADLADQLFPYLTMAEGIKLAAQAFTRDVRQLSCCAG